VLCFVRSPCIWLPPCGRSWLNQWSFEETVPKKYISRSVYFWLKCFIHLVYDHEFSFRILVCEGQLLVVSTQIVDHSSSLPVCFSKMLFSTHIQKRDLHVLRGKFFLNACEWKPEMRPWEGLSSKLLSRSTAAATTLVCLKATVAYISQNSYNFVRFFYPQRNQLRQHSPVTPTSSKSI